MRKEQSVKIRSIQSLTNGIEPTIALHEVTSVMKPIGGTYQAATQVKVLSPENYDIIEADVFHSAEGSMKGGDMVSHHSLYRGLSPWHDMRWNLRKLGRSSMFSKEYARTSQNRRELANDIALLCHIQINSTQFAKNIKMPLKIFNLELQRDG